MECGLVGRAGASAAPPHTASSLTFGSQAILMCRLLGVPFELRAPNGLTGPDAETKQAAYLRMNPLGQVPVLVDPNAAPELAAAYGLDEPAGALHCSEGLVVRDSAAILTYLALTYGAASWLPVAEPVRAARVAQWVSYGGGEVNNSLLKVRVSVLFGWDILPMTLEGALAASRNTLAYLDAQLAAGAKAGRTWLVAGDAPTIADVHVFPYVAFAEDSSQGALKMADYPAVCAWVAAFSKLPGYVAPPGLE